MRLTSLPRFHWWKWHWVPWCELLVCYRHDGVLQPSLQTWGYRQQPPDATPVWVPLVRWPCALGGTSPALCQGILARDKISVPLLEPVSVLRRDWGPCPCGIGHPDPMSLSTMSHLHERLQLLANAGSCSRLGGGGPLGKLRHEASQGHSLAKSTAECEDLLLVRHSTLLRVPAFGAVSQRAAGVQLHPQHPDG